MSTAITHVPKRSAHAVGASAQEKYAQAGSIPYITLCLGWQAVEDAEKRMVVCCHWPQTLLEAEAKTCPNRVIIMTPHLTFVILP